MNLFNAFENTIVCIVVNYKYKLVARIQKSVFCTAFETVFSRILFVSTQFRRVCLFLSISYFRQFDTMCFGWFLSCSSLNASYFMPIIQLLFMLVFPFFKKLVFPCGSLFSLEFFSFVLFCFYLWWFCYAKTSQYLCMRCSLIVKIWIWMTFLYDERIWQCF